MPTKTASVRLEKTLYDRIDEHCVRVGCCRNDFIKNAIESALKDNKKDDDVVGSKPHYDRFGNYWTFDKKTDKWTCHLDSKNIKLR
jgi:predicted DNA-binding protein